MASFFDTEEFQDAEARYGAPGGLFDDDLEEERSRYVRIPPQDSPADSFDDDSTLTDENEMPKRNAKKDDDEEEPFVMEEGEGLEGIKKHCGGSFDQQLARQPSTNARPSSNNGLRDVLKSPNSLFPRPLRDNVGRIYLLKSSFFTR